MENKKCSNYRKCGLDYCDYGIECPEYKSETAKRIEKGIHIDGQETLSERELIVIKREVEDECLKMDISNYTEK